MDAPNNNPAQGIALRCDAQGRILAVTRDDLGLTGPGVVGQAFTQLVDRSCLPKALDFLVEIRTRGAALGWELNVGLGHGLESVHFAGLATTAEILIAGARTRTETMRLYEAMMEMSNEQANSLRAALKDCSALQRSQTERDSALYDEISRLNNDLVTLQRELAKKNAELAKLNDLKNQFLGMAAHDLRTPLGAILSYSEFLLEEVTTVLTPEQLEFLTVIRSSSDFMLKLVEDLLDVSKIEAGKLELDLQAVALATLIEHSVMLNRVMAAKKKTEIAFSQEGTVPSLLLDAGKMEQVIQNLLSNAVKFSPPGSCVRVRLKAESDHVILSVRDQGPGIPDAELPKLFLPFSRTLAKATGGEKGTGLGLVIAKRIVQGHGGRIWVESRPGEGCTFLLSLPSAAPAQEPQR